MRCITSGKEKLLLRRSSRKLTNSWQKLYSFQTNETMTFGKFAHCRIVDGDEVSRSKVHSLPRRIQAPYDKAEMFSRKSRLTGQIFFASRQHVESHQNFDRLLTPANPLASHQTYIGKQISATSFQFDAIHATVFTVDKQKRL